MKKFTVILLLAAALALALGACLPVDGEPEGIGAGMAGEDEVSRTISEEPEKIEGWGEGVSSFAAYRWNGGLLKNLQFELDLVESGVDLGGSEIWWINDQTVSALYGEDIIADGACYDGVFRFTFNSRQEDSELAAAAGITEDELSLWAREWDWPNYGYMVRGWELAVTYKPLPEGRWVTPSWWLPPEGLTGKGEDNGSYAERMIAGPSRPEPTPLPEDRQAVEDFKFPGWEPVEGHEGYEMAVVHTAYDGRPLQVRLRWKNGEGFGFWAQLPAHALDSFWEHEGEWFIKVTVSGEGRESENSDSSDSSEIDAVSSQRGDESSWYADNYLLESSPAYQDREGLLVDLFRATEQDEYWWLDEEAAEKIVPNVPDGRENWLNAGTEKGLISFGYITEETGLDESARTYEFYVTALPGEDALTPKHWAPSHPEWGPANGHPGFEMSSAPGTDDGLPVSVRLRWQSDDHWFMAQIPVHRLDAFWENYEGLFVKMDRSSVQREG